MLFVSVFYGCSQQNSESTVADTTTVTRAQSWVATTGHIADALREISAGTNVNIKTLCGPGVDPHSYNASTNDVQAIANADAVFFNGFHLEARLHHLLETEFGDKSWAMAAAFPPPLEPTKRKFLRPKATQRIERSAELLSSSNEPFVR